MSLSENIKNLRIKKNLSQKELAEAIYVSRSAIAKWENGNGIPSESNLAEMASYFKVEKTDITGEPSEWAKEVERIKAGYNRNSRKKLILLAGAITALFVCILFFLLCHTVYKKMKNCFTISLDDDNTAEVIITKNAGLFSDGEIYVLEYTSEMLPDTVRFQNGMLCRRYRIVSMNYNFPTKWGAYQDKNINKYERSTYPHDLLYVPRYVTSFCGTYQTSFTGKWILEEQDNVYGCFDYITVSPENQKYDSRENSNCLIETVTNKLILGSSKSFIPDSVTSLGMHSFGGYIPLKLIIPSSIKTIGKYTFDGMTQSDDNSVVIYVEKGVEEIDSYGFYSAYISKLILPSTIIKMNADSVVSSGSRYRGVLYYQDSEDEFMNVIEASTGSDGGFFRDSYGTFRFPGKENDFKGYVYFYCAYEPVDKTNLWHYDADGNPVLWAEEN